MRAIAVILAGIAIMGTGIGAALVSGPLAAPPGRFSEDTPKALRDKGECIPLEYPSECADSEGTTWVNTDPVQCLANSWEEDWCESHPGERYPQDWAGQETIIADYYGRLGIAVHEVEFREWGLPVCAACSCAAGYTLYLLVDDEDVEAMLGLDYRLGGS